MTARTQGASEAGQLRQEALLTSAVVDPKLTAVPKGKFYKWLHCKRGTQDAASSSPYVEKKEEENYPEQPKKIKNKGKEDEERETNSAPEDGESEEGGRTQKAVMEENVVVKEGREKEEEVMMKERKVQDEKVEVEEGKEKNKGALVKEGKIQDEEVEVKERKVEDEVEEVEEEKIQEKAQSGSTSWWPCCCCLFTFLLCVATYTRTHDILEHTSRRTPTPEELNTEMITVPLLVITAVWTLCAFPSPNVSLVYEGQVFIALFFCNVSLVLGTKAVVAAMTTLTYWCWWLVALLCPFLLMVLLCFLYRLRA